MKNICVLCLMVFSLAACVPPGLATSQYNHAVKLYTGDGIVQDYTKAAEFWDSAASITSDADSQYALGFMHYNGIGVVQDNVQAEIYWKEAAQQGHVGAQEMLNEMKKDIPNIPESLPVDVLRIRED